MLEWLGFMTAFVGGALALYAWDETAEIIGKFIGKYIQIEWKA